jgi:hypothetical protein
MPEEQSLPPVGLNVSGDAPSDSAVFVPQANENISIQEEQSLPVVDEKKPSEKKGNFFSRLFSKKNKNDPHNDGTQIPSKNPSEIYEKVLTLGGTKSVTSEEELLKNISDNKVSFSEDQQKKIILEDVDVESVGESNEILEKRKKEELEKIAERNSKNFLIISQSVVFFVSILAFVVYGIFSAFLDSEGVFVKVFPNNYGIQKKNLEIDLEAEVKQIASMQLEIQENNGFVDGVKNNTLIDKIRKYKINWVKAIERLNTVAKTAPTLGTNVTFDTYSSKTGTRELIVQGRIDVPSGRVFLEIGKLIDAFNGNGTRSEMTKYFSGAKLMNYSKIKNEKEGTEAASMIFNFTLQYYPEGRDASEAEETNNSSQKK